MKNEDFPVVIDAIDEYRSMMFLYNAGLKEINTKLEILNDEFQYVHSYNPIEHIKSRIKSEKSIMRKLQRKGLPVTIRNIQKHVNDIAGIRITCSFTTDIYRLVDMISDQSDIEVISYKDYFIDPKPSGYRSYHMIVTVPVFLSDRMVRIKVEIQIRTVAMDFWASLEHKIYYKFDGNAPVHIRKELRECAEMIAYMESKMLRINEEVRSYRH